MRSVLFSRHYGTLIIIFVSSPGTEVPGYFHGVPTARRVEIESPDAGSVCSVLVLLVILVGLALAHRRRLPDQPAPLVGLAQELQRGERLDGVVLQAEHLGDGLQRL